MDIHVAEKEFDEALEFRNQSLIVHTSPVVDFLLCGVRECLMHSLTSERPDLVHMV